MDHIKRPSGLSKFLHNKWTERVVDLVLVPVLLLYSLWLPPASMGIRLFHSDYPVISPQESASIAGPDGATLDVPAGAVEKRTRLRLKALNGDGTSANGLGNAYYASTVGSNTVHEIRPDSGEYLALQSVPSDLVVYGPIYAIDTPKDLPDEGSMSLPVPYELAMSDLADVYAWDGARWYWVPSRVSDDDLTVNTELDPMPAAVMLAQWQPGSPRVSLDVTTENLSPIVADANATELSVHGFYLSDGGALDGDAPTAADIPFDGEKRMVISNIIGGIVRSDLVDNLIIDSSAVDYHVGQAVEAAQVRGYDGVELAYSGVDPTLTSDMNTLVERLSTALHLQGMNLAVRVDAPAHAGDGWDTNGYDWDALGQAADYVRIPALIDPASYSDGTMDRFVAWATDQIDRRKVDLALSAYSYDSVADQTYPISYADALNVLARGVNSSDPDQMVLPGESVSLSLPGLGATELQLDPEAQVYSFMYNENGDTHTVWLTNASSVARKLSYVTQNALGGAIVDGVDIAENDSDIAQIVSDYQNNLAAPMPRFAFVWQISDASGNKVDEQVMPITDPNWTWVAPNNPGNYIISASMSDDGGESNMGAAAELDIQVPTPTFTPTATPTNTPTNTPIPTDTPTPTPEPTAKPKPKPAAAPGGYFGYGVQVDLLTDSNQQRVYDHIKGMGFNWVKQQVEWFRFNGGPGQYDWAPLDRIVDGANANGINVMFSVVKAPSWARPPGDTDQGPPADPNTYATFVREMAARYKGRVKAYEVWNEQNLYYEWGGRGGKLSAAAYMNLLKPAYNAIKSVDPGAVVISGALTPTGVNDGDIAIDDRLYLEQMYQNGLARYCDAVGAHPSGFNNPADADWRTFSDPTAPSFKGHPSFFFRGTMESYRNIMVAYGDGGKRIWATEFGWATVENFGVGPAEGYGFAADNTEAEQAQYLVRAYEMGRSWGFAGPMFLWNLNFAPVAGRSDEKAAFGIVREDWGARPAYSALRDMAK